MQKNIEWIICDLDGTLLRYENYSHVIDKKAIEVIHNLGNKNIEFSIATGRHYKDALKICIENDLVKEHTKYIIGCNGGIIFDTLANKIIFKKIMNKNQLIKSFSVLNYLLNKGIEVLLAGYKLNRNVVFNPEIKTKRNLVNEFLNYEGNFSEFKFDISNDFVSETNILKTIFFFDIDFLNKNQITIENIYQELKEMFNFSKGELCITSKQSIECNPDEISKGNAIKMLSKKLDIDLNHTLSIGDSGNDISMFEVTKYSSTLESSIDSVKQKATKVFPTIASKIVIDTINFFVK
ncbi:Cof-type HAD-IIB family hydrolase [Mycoplasmoides alvi]|uniref:Cof-type HAD-IIB family hydrolase n=1 Tax=Mycoplasmoides alvi TaxID=78580 RepID=UPI00051AB2EE|nr:Cof-type HAD-IIB family hydrolase [Mycoplasmoides alvi]